LRLNQFIQQFLIPISGEEVFEDRNSPQFRAATYIADVDPYTSQLTTVEQLEDRYAAVTFYFATGGDDWKRCYYGDESCTEGQWLVDDVCGWFAVACDEVGRISGFLFGTEICVCILPIETLFLCVCLIYRFCCVFVCMLSFA
jgi:hypothetical protein